MKHPGNNEILTVQQLSQFRFGKPDDIRRLEREQQELRWAIEGRSQYDGEPLFGEGLPARLQGGNAPDQDHLRTLLAKNAQTLEAMRPPADLTPIQKRRYHQLERELSTKLHQTMPSANMMNDPTERNVDINMAWQMIMAPQAIAWMNVRQILDSSNDSPFYTNVEVLRPINPPQVDLRQFRMNFDNIAFLDKTEKLGLTLDDEQYEGYLRLKVLDWSDKGIMRELGMSRAVLELANARLAEARMRARQDGDAWDESPEPDEPDEPIEEQEEEGEEESEEEGTEEAGESPPEDSYGLGVETGVAVAEVPVKLKPLWDQPDASRAWLREELRRYGLTQPVFARALGHEGEAVNNWCQMLTKRADKRFLHYEWAKITHLLTLFQSDPAYFDQFGFIPPGRRRVGAESA